MRKLPDLNDELIELRVLLLRTIASIWKSDEEQCSLENGLPNKDTVITKITEHLSGETVIEHHDHCEQVLIMVLYIHISKAEKRGGSIEVVTYLNLFLECDEVMNKTTLVLLQEKGLLRTFVESCDPKNLNAFWNMFYGSTIDFKNFGVQIIKPTARWNYYGDNQWTKPDTEALYLSLPMYLSDMYNKNTDQILLATKLTEYYQKFPSFFGLTSEQGSQYPQNELGQLNKATWPDFLTLDPNEKPPAFFDSTLNLEGRQFNKSQKDPSGNNYDLGMSTDVFLGFSSMLIKLIPVLWENKELRERLNYAQRMASELNLAEYSLKNAGTDTAKCHFKSEFELSYILSNLEGELAEKRDKINSQYDIELNAILREHFNYVNPWVFNIRLIYPDEVAFKSIINDFGRSLPENSKEYILNMATIEVPYAPEKRDKADTSLALARYNATGPSFPFTCS